MCIQLPSRIVPTNLYPFEADLGTAMLGVALVLTCLISFALYAMRLQHQSRTPILRQFGTLLLSVILLIYIAEMLIALMLIFMEL